MKFVTLLALFCFLIVLVLAQGSKKTCLSVPPATVFDSSVFATIPWGICAISFAVFVATVVLVAAVQCVYNDWHWPWIESQVRYFKAKRAARHGQRLLDVGPRKGLSLRKKAEEYHLAAMACQGAEEHRIENHLMAVAHMYYALDARGITTHDGPSLVAFNYERAASSYEAAGMQAEAVQMSALAGEHFELIARRPTDGIDLLDAISRYLSAASAYRNAGMLDKAAEMETLAKGLNLSTHPNSHARSQLHHANSRSRDQ